MRTCLNAGTVLRVPGGILYKITGEPIGEGGGSLIYPASRYLPEGESYRKSPILYAIKECYPLSAQYTFFRNTAGEILQEQETEEARQYLERVKQMQLAENSITGEIYHTGFRLTPVLETFQEIELSFDGGVSFQKVRNSISVMESLSLKGQSLKHCLKERKHLPALWTFRIIQQVLYALREVHAAGYLHLDIQDGNIFLKGQLDDNSGMISLIDFGSSRRRMEDGRCEMIEDRVLYSTPGFSAPEMISQNDGTLRLGPEADIYSVGCLALLLLTGHRCSAQELCANQTERYIPRFSLRKTGCPKHLTDQMQSILAKALKNQPQDRYADVEEMLGEVTAFLALLTPYQNPLSQTKYDAFICYKHGERDTLAARELRNALERFKKGCLPGKKSIGKVFLDEGELASCADFGQQIREILKDTGWLIVICSKTTKESPWVNDEITTFLKYHDTSRVLAVVTEGEPGEVFPGALLKNGLDETCLFAADARGERTKQVIKNIKNDVRLKIAAPILQTTYDTLKQRNKVYQMKRTFVLASTVLLTFCVFLGYAAAKSREIADQALKLVREHQTALVNQARYLSEQARQSYEEQDFMTAMDQALKGCELLAEEETLLPDLIWTLSKSMGLYTLPMNADRTVTAEGVFRLGKDGGYEEYFLDGEGNYLFTADDIHVYLWDTDTFQCIKTITAPWTITRFDENYLMDQRDEYLLVLQDNIICYDYEKESSVWEFSFDEPVMAVRISDDQTRIVVVTNQMLYLFDAEGNLLQTSAVPVEEGESLSDTPLILTSDNRQIAFVRTREGEDSKYLLETVLYRAEEDRYTVVASEKSEQSLTFTPVSLYFTDDNKLFMAWGTGVNTIYAGSSYQYDSVKKSLKLCVYDTDKEGMLWEDTKEYMAIDEKILVCDTEYGTCGAIFLVYGKRLEFLDENTGKILDSYEADAPAICAWCTEGKAVAVLENGDFLEHSYDGDALRGYGYFPEKLAGCKVCGEDYYIRKRQDDSFQNETAIIKYRENVYDTGYEICAALKDESEAEDCLPKGITYPAQEREVEVGKETARIEGDSIVTEDHIFYGDGTLLSLFGVPGTDWLLAGYTDKVQLYDLSLGALIDTVGFGENTYSHAAWQLIDESTVLFMGDRESYVLEVSQDAFGILYGLKDFLAYDEEEDTFYFLSSTYSMERLNEGVISEAAELGKIKRYHKEDIVVMAKKRAKDGIG